MLTAHALAMEVDGGFLNRQFKAWTAKVGAEIDAYRKEMRLDAETRAEVGFHPPYAVPESLIAGKIPRLGWQDFGTMLLTGRGSASSGNRYGTRGAVAAFPLRSTRADRPQN